MKKTVAAIAAAAMLALAFGAAPVAASAAPADCRSIPVDADLLLKSDLARAEFGVDGTGVKVGIISNSYNVNASLSTEAENIADGLLPGADNPCGHSTPVHVLSDYPAPTPPSTTPLGDDEGRAMAQMVHGVAPGAELFFASAGVDYGDMIPAMDLLAAQGVDIIVDDVILDSEPFYQKSTISSRIDQLVADGITYLSAAGNNTALATGPLPGQDATPIGAWETSAYRPIGCGPALTAQLGTLAGTEAYDCMDFDPGVGEQPTSTYTVDTGELPSTSVPGTTLVLAELKTVMQWAEPFGAAAGDFEMFVTTNVTDTDLGTGTTGTVVAIPLDPSTAGDPMRIGNVLFVIDPAAPGAEVTMSVSLVRVTNSAEPRTDIEPAIGFTTITDGYQWAVNADRWRSEGPDTVGRSIVGHNGAPAAITVAATNAFGDERVENFSSLGPVTYYLASQADGGATLAEPVVLNKPNILSVDGSRQNVLVAGPGYGSDVYQFEGTSSATPIAGAVAALALQLNPTLTPAELQALLARTATPLPSPYPTISAENSVGAGLINAQALLATIDAALPVPVTPVDRPVLASSGGTDAASALLLGVGMLALGAALVTARLRTRSAR